MKKTKNVTILNRSLYDTEMLAKPDVELHFEREAAATKGTRGEVYHLRPVMKPYSYHQFI